MTLEEQDKQQFRAQSEQRNTGSIDNYRLAFADVQTDYFCLLPDDDQFDPEFFESIRN